MADKDHEKTAESLSSLSPGPTDQWDWYSGFFETLRNEWDLIDSYRISKYMYLVRLFVRAMLENSVSDTSKWRNFLTSLIEKCTNKAMALVYHISDILLDEFHEKDLKPKLEIVLPFIELMKTTKLTQVIELVYQKILLKLAENQSNELTNWVFTLATSE